MYKKIKIFFPGFLLFTILTASYAQVQQQKVEFATTPVHKIDGIAWATPIGTNMVTGSQYWVYINASLEAVVAKKDKNGTLTTKTLMTNVANDDNHAEFSLGIDNDGFIHVIGGEHNSVPYYYVSKNPDDITDFEFRGNDLSTGGIQGTQITYQSFFRSNKGTLFVTYRNNVVEDFVTGARSIALARYDTRTKKWTMIGGKNYQVTNQNCTNITGEQSGIVAFVWNPSGVGDMRPPTGKCFSQAHYQGYQLKIVFDQNNTMHVSYNMADSINMSSGQDVSKFMTHLFYAYSPDEGNSWFKANGQQITNFPVTKATGDLVYKCIPSGYVYPAVTSTGTMSNASTIMLDKDGIPMVMQYEYIADKTRMFRWNGSKWEDKSDYYDYPNDKLFTNLTKKEIYNFGPSSQFQMSTDNMGTWKNSVTMTNPCTWYVVIDRYYLQKSGNVKYYARDETNDKATIMTMVTTSPDAQAPAAPAGLLATEKAQNSFVVEWNAATELDVCKYEIYKNNTLIGSTASTYFRLTGLAVNTSYNVSVKAVDASGNASAMSASLQVTTNNADTQPPTAPTNLNATDIAASTLKLNWDAGTDNVGVVSYDIYQDNTFKFSTTYTSCNISGLTGNTTYNFSVIAKDAAGNSSTSATTTAKTFGAGLIIYEPFDYTVGATNPDPDAGSNGGNGLPATNDGGNPSATSTGIRGLWGNATVVEGLTYPGLPTKGNAMRTNKSGWATDMYAYRFMTTDPFLTYRVGDSNTGAFGKDGTVMYMSLLAQTSSTTANAFKFKISNSRNMFVVNTATHWSLDDNGGGAKTSTATMQVNTTAFIVLKFEFKAGTGDVVSLYKNPQPGTEPTVADVVLTSTGDLNGILQFNQNPAVADAMIVDEIRLGLTYQDVAPSATTTAIVDRQLSGYPLSFTNETLSVKNAIGKTLIVSSLWGQVLINKAIKNEIDFFDLSGLLKGVYLVSVRSDSGENYTCKIIKN
jgi:chitodextrinase